MRSSLLVLLGLFGLLLVSAPVAAQPSPEPPRTEAELRRAKQLEADAQASYQRNDWRAALEDYTAAYQLSQNPQLLFSMGQCQRNMGLYQDAAASYRDFLQRADKTLSDEDRQELNGLLVETEALLDKQRRGLLPAASLQATPEALPLDNSKNSPLEAPLPLVSTRISPRVYAPFLALTGVTMISALFTGSAARRSADELALLSQDPEVTPEGLSQRYATTTFLALGTDALTITAISACTIGVIRWSDAKRELSAKLSTSAVALQLRF